MTYGRRGVGPTVVLLHGWCLNREMWRYHEEALASSADVVTPDLAGFGESAALAGPFTLDRYAADIEDLLEETSSDGATLVGFAFGAAIALAVAARKRSSLERLILIGVPSASHAAYDRMPRAMRRDWPLFAERSATAICGESHSDATLAWLTSIFGAAPLPVAIETCGLLGAFEPELLCGQVDTPTILVHGAEDSIVPVSVAHACASALKDGVVTVIPNSGHLVVLDAKDELRDLIQTALGLQIDER